MAYKNDEGAKGIKSMTPMSDMNSRAARIWEIYGESVDWKDAVVADLGCGGGDMIYRLALAGARKIYAVDKDRSLLAKARERVISHGIAIEHSNIEFIQHDLNNLYMFHGLRGDVALSFSVLPYLNDMRASLKLWSERFDTLFIECQYDGDGPGPSIIKTDVDMRAFLDDCDWSAEILGSNTVKQGAHERTIWKCNSNYRTDLTNVIQ